jgi:hypothetical protein
MKMETRHGFDLCVGSKVDGNVVPCEQLFHVATPFLGREHGSWLVPGR